MTKLHNKTVNINQKTFNPLTHRKLENPKLGFRTL